MSIENYKGQKMKTKKKEEGISGFDLVLMIAMVSFLCWIFLFSVNSILDGQDRRIKEKFGGYPAEILQPVTLKLLPDLIDEETKGIVFIKRGCLNASRESLEAIRDNNNSDKDVYIIGGHPVKIEVKICGE